MLPNWLYGKSKSKLAELLGGGGTPSDYNQVKAQVTQNTEDIASLDDTLDTKAALTQISNSNLLDNPWFTVNQRGQSSYSSNGYTLDRWKRNAENVAGHKITIGRDNIEIPLLKGDFYQPIETASNHWRHVPYTVSAIIDGNLYSKTFTPYDDGQQHMGSASWGSTSIGLDGLIWNIVENWTPSSHLIGINNNGASQDHTITAVKLELGSVSTLAMDTAPNYTTELLKCQRYFHKYATEALRPSNMYDCVPEMRATPTQSTITIDSTTYYVNSADL